jgi:hypothetical protein
MLAHCRADFGQPFSNRIGELQIRRNSLADHEKSPPSQTMVGFWSHQVGAAGFEPTTWCTRPERPFQNCLTIIDDREVARRCDAQKTGSRRLAGLKVKAERSSAPLASKIGGGSAIGQDSGGDAGDYNTSRSGVVREITAKVVCG